MLSENTVVTHGCERAREELRTLVVVFSVLVQGLTLGRLARRFAGPRSRLSKPNKENDAHEDTHRRQGSYT